MLSETPKEEVEPATGAGVGRSIQSSGNYRSHSFGWKRAWRVQGMERRPDGSRQGEDCQRD